jgi:hypothetical protein
VEALTHYLANDVLGLRPPPDESQEAHAAPADDLEDLSEHDMAALLSQQLAAGRRKRAGV